MLLHLFAMLTLLLDLSLLLTVLLYLLTMLLHPTLLTLHPPLPPPPTRAAASPGRPPRCRALPPPDARLLLKCPCWVVRQSARMAASPAGAGGQPSARERSGAALAAGHPWPAPSPAAFALPARLPASSPSAPLALSLAPARMAASTVAAPTTTRAGSPTQNPALSFWGHPLSVPIGNAY